MKLTKLEEKLKPLAQYKLVTQVTKRGEDEYHLMVIDEDIFDYEDDETGEMLTENASVMVAGLHLNGKGVIDFIEHGYQAFTKANKRDVLLLANLIGEQVDVEDLMA